MRRAVIPLRGVTPSSRLICEHCKTRWEAQDERKPIRGQDHLAYPVPFVTAFAYRAALHPARVLTERFLHTETSTRIV